MLLSSELRAASYKLSAIGPDERFTAEDLNYNCLEQGKHDANCSFKYASGDVTCLGR